MLMEEQKVNKGQHQIIDQFDFLLLNTNRKFIKIIFLLKNK